MIILKYMNRTIQTCTRINKNLLLVTNGAVNIICKRNLNNIEDDDEGALKTSLSKAMKEFATKIENYEKSMVEKEEEFAFGKRHLANMMGIPIEKLNSYGIKHSIEYLFPSALTQIAAKPMMVPPREIYPIVDNEVQFDDSGRPLDSLFYTGKTKYYHLLQEIGEEQKRLDKILYSKEYNTSEENLKINLVGTKWAPFNQIIQNQRLTDFDYNFFTKSMYQLCTHPLSSFANNFIMKYRQDFWQTDVRPIAMVDQIDGRLVSSDWGRKKKAHADVTVKMNGTGLFNINDMDILYFQEELHRAAVVFPLIFTNLGMKVDVNATVSHETIPNRSKYEFRGVKKHLGDSACAGAIRLALSRALLPFVEENMRKRMRIAGLITSDIRKKERKKPGKKGARKERKWKAR